MNAQINSVEYFAMPVLQKAIQARAKEVWPANLAVKTTYGTFPLVVNDYVLPLAASKKNIERMELYLHMLAALAIMNALEYDRDGNVLMRVSTSDLNNLFYAKASNKQGAFTVDIFQGYQRPFEGINLPPLTDRNACVTHCTNCMNNGLGSINGDIPYAQRFYSYTDDFVIVTSCQNGNVVCDIDSSYKYVLVNDNDKDGYYLPLLKRIGFINGCPPVVWDFSHYF